MEDDMRSRHLEEMADLLTSPDEDIDYEELAKLSVQPSSSEAPKEKKNDQERHGGKKISKAQKRRVREPSFHSSTRASTDILSIPGC